MTTADLDEARERLEELVDRALAGEEVAIVRDGVPLVKLIAVSTAPPRRLGWARGKIRMAPDFDED